MTPARRDLLILGGVAGAAALGGALLGALAIQSAGGAAELLSARFTDLQGRVQRLIDWRGRALICNFWATWCAPCREEVPMLVAAKQKFARTPLEIVGIAIDDAAKVRDFAANFEVNYPIFLGNAETIGIMRKLGNTRGALPYNVALDRHGAVAHRKLGAFTADELRQVIDGLLQ